MSRSNRLAPNERKIGYLLGEQADLNAELAKATALIRRMPQIRQRLSEIAKLIEAGASFIKDDHPNWTLDRVIPLRKWRHKNPLPLGYLTKTALATLRNADRPMTCREVTDAVLARYDYDDPTPDEVNLVLNAVQQAFAKRRGGVLASDGGWPEEWWVATKRFECLPSASGHSFARSLDDENDQGDGE